MTVCMTVLYRRSGAERLDLIAGAMRMVLTLNLGVRMCGFHDIYGKHKCMHPAILFFLPI